jgi:hypothetical protein
MMTIKIVKTGTKTPKAFGGGCDVFVDDNGVTAKKK